jgi:putative transposase
LLDKAASKPAVDVPRAAKEMSPRSFARSSTRPTTRPLASTSKDVAGMLRPRSSEAADLLEHASEDILAHMHFPKEHRRRLRSTNTVERLHMEIKRRTRVIGIFPNRSSLLRMVGTLLQEQDDKWQVAERRYFSIESMHKIDVGLERGEDAKELLAAIT